MKSPFAAWTAAFFMGTAFVAMPTLDSQDRYLQAAQAETAAERVAKLDRQASQEAAEAQKHYEEMTDYEVMRGVVYEPEGDAQ
ncbi:hypothetical protein A7Q01_00940 [Eikenella sp. NML96-A-049]|uniref:hypothetical protein n=1 Tax=unclassified Eikenella TaxID=2639367 RepID=UPI0007E0F6B4|nr:MULTISPECIES: hypothetical protein [unclassified Eikenella]OAM33552.1 hypothetical protein A7P97_08215 [Eikenella sp. NML070372]OAM42484.1 hypothetical protein A7Q01_00940 [Eikenella sp. NML96-A-049]